MAPRVGHVYLDSQFYVELTSGQFKQKYFLVLAAPERGDVVIRLLTSRYMGIRPESPPCFHGDPYPGFYLGVLGGSLGSKSWLDLRQMEDIDRWDFARHEESGRLAEIMVLPGLLLRPAMACAANANDTTRQQERVIRDALAALGEAF